MMRTPVVHTNALEPMLPKRAPALAGVLAVMLAMCGAKWGSYLGFPPIFLTDILIALAVIHHLLGKQTYSERTTSTRAPCPGVVLLGLYLAWAIGRFVAGTRIDQFALRDFAPFLYAATGLLAASSLGASSEKSRRRTSQFLIWALGLHAGWVFIVSVVAIQLPSRMPIMSGSPGFHFLDLRPDFDSAMVGVFSGWLILQIVRGKHAAWSSLALLACLSTFVYNDLRQSRAGLLGAIICVLLAGWVAQHDAHTTTSRKAIFALILPLALIATLVAGPTTVVGQRLVGTFGGFIRQLR